MTKFHPLQLSGYQDLPLLSFVLRYQLNMSSGWTHQCKIGWNLHLSGKTQYLTDSQSIMQNTNTFAAGQTKSILTNTRSSRSHNFCCELCKFLEHLFCITCHDHLQNRCSKKPRKIHAKTPVLKSLFKKAKRLLK